MTSVGLEPTRGIGGPVVALEFLLRIADGQPVEVPWS